MIIGFIKTLNRLPGSPKCATG